MPRAHRITAVYTSRGEARAARERLLAHGLGPDRVFLLDAPGERRTLELGTGGGGIRPNTLLPEVTASVLLGAGVGVALALIVAAFRAELASPLSTLLAGGAAIGALAGAAASVCALRANARGDEPPWEALADGRSLLIVDARSEHEARDAQALLGSAVEPWPRAACGRAEAPHGRAVNRAP